MPRQTTAARPATLTTPGSSLSKTITTGTDGLVSVYSASDSSTKFYTLDERGNTAPRLDKMAVIVSSDQYDAYGTVTSTAGTRPDLVGFGGQAAPAVSAAGWAKPLTISTKAPLKIVVFAAIGYAISSPSLLCVSNAAVKAAMETSFLKLGVAEAGCRKL